MFTWEQPGTHRRAMRFGAEWQARRTLLRQGAAKFGGLDDATQKRVEAITDLAELDRLSLRLLTAGSWQELLGPE